MFRGILELALAASLILVSTALVMWVHHKIDSKP